MTMTKKIVVETTRRGKRGYPISFQELLDSQQINESSGEGKPVSSSADFLESKIGGITISSDEGEKDIPLVGDEEDQNVEDKNIEDQNAQEQSNEDQEKAKKIEIPKSLLENDFKKHLYKSFRKVMARFKTFNYYDKNGNRITPTKEQLSRTGEHPITLREYYSLTENEYRTETTPSGAFLIINRDNRKEDGRFNYEKIDRRMENPQLEVVGKRGLRLTAEGHKLVTRDGNHTKLFLDGLKLKNKLSEKDLDILIYLSVFPSSYAAILEDLYNDQEGSKVTDHLSNQKYVFGALRAQIYQRAKISDRAKTILSKKVKSIGPFARLIFCALNNALKTSNYYDLVRARTAVSAYSDRLYDETKHVLSEQDIRNIVFAIEKFSVLHDVVLEKHGFKSDAYKCFTTSGPLLGLFLTEFAGRGTEIGSKKVLIRNKSINQLLKNFSNKHSTIATQLKEISDGTIDRKMMNSVEVILKSLAVG